jgi:hypothetical protein
VNASRSDYANEYRAKRDSDFSSPKADNGLSHGGFALARHARSLF